MKRLTALLSAIVALAVLTGCMAITSFDVYEGPRQNGVPQPFRVQVILSANETDVIIVSWGDDTESAWGGEVYAQRANIQHTYNTEGIYAISVSRNGDPLGVRMVLIEEAI